MEEKKNPESLPDNKAGTQVSAMTNQRILKAQFSYFNFQDFFGFLYIFLFKERKKNFLC